MNPAAAPTADLSAPRGKRLLQWAVWLYVPTVVLPAGQLAVTSGGWVGGVGFVMGGILSALLLTRHDRSIHLLRVTGWLPFILLTALLVKAPLALLIVAAWAGLIVTAPWTALRGSNGTRTLAGLFSLVGALLTFPWVIGFSASQWIPAVISLGQFLAFCFLVNAFLLNRHVRAWVAEDRAAMGLSPDHWRMDGRC